MLPITPVISACYKAHIKYFFKKKLEVSGIHANSPE